MTRAKRSRRRQRRFARKLRWPASLRRVKRTCRAVLADAAAPPKMRRQARRIDRILDDGQIHRIALAERIAEGAKIANR